MAADHSRRRSRHGDHHEAGSVDPEARPRARRRCSGSVRSSRGETLREALPGGGSPVALVLGVGDQVHGARSDGSGRRGRRRGREGLSTRRGHPRKESSEVRGRHRGPRGDPRGAGNARRRPGAGPGGVGDASRLQGGEQPEGGGGAPEDVGGARGAGRHASGAGYRGGGDERRRDEREELEALRPRSRTRRLAGTKRREG